MDGECDQNYEILKEIDQPSNPRNDDHIIAQEHSYVKHSHVNQRIANDALEYVAGYVSFKTGQFGSNPVTDEESWVPKVSEGGLTIPDKTTEKAVLDLENIFKNCNKKFICDKPAILSRMIKEAEIIDISLEYKKKQLRT